jgi:hypothetical protein
MARLMDSKRTLMCTAVEVWRNEQLLKVIEGYKPENMYSCNEAGLFFVLPPNKTLSVKGNPCSGGKNSKDRMTVTLACNTSATGGLPPSVVGRSEKVSLLYKCQKLACKIRSQHKSVGYTCHFYLLRKGVRCLNEF